MPLRVTVDLIGGNEHARPTRLAEVWVFNTDPQLPEMSDYRWTMTDSKVGEDEGFIGGHRRRAGWAALLQRVFTQISCKHRGRRADGICTQCGKDVEKVATQAD